MAEIANTFEIELQKAKRTPRTPESIEAGALRLPLEERVSLCKKLAVSIQEEVAAKRADLDKATKLIDGLK